MDLRAAFETPAPAIVLAEGEFGEPGGKTANGVVAHSELFDARAVIDSTSAGPTARSVLDLSADSADPAESANGIESADSAESAESANATESAEPADSAESAESANATESADLGDIPCVDSIEQALSVAPSAGVLVIGVAPAGGQLPDEWASIIERAMAAGCDVVSGLHSFLSETDHWMRLADRHDVRLFDVRKPPDELRVGDGSVADRSAAVVCTLGTDCAVGKRTTTFELYRAARNAGVDAAWVATGQTGIMVGAHRGVVVDRVPADFAAGVVERLVGDVADDHELVFVEGQAALTHRAYAGVTLSILHGAWPDAVVLADDPARDRRTHFEQFPVAGLAAERRAIEAVSATPVVAVSTWGDPERVTEQTGLPAANTAREGGPDRLLTAVQTALNDQRAE